VFRVSRGVPAPPGVFLPVPVPSREIAATLVAPLLSGATLGAALRMKLGSPWSVNVSEKIHTETPMRVGVKPSQLGRSAENLFSKFAEPLFHSQCFFTPGKPHDNSQYRTTTGTAKLHARGASSSCLAHYPIPTCPANTPAPQPPLRLPFTAPSVSRLVSFAPSKRQSAHALQAPSLNL
jgi:hypothetical protein